MNKSIAIYIRKCIIICSLCKKLVNRRALVLAYGKTFN